MLKKNASKNKEISTKQRRSASSLPPSRLFRLLLAVLALKLSVLGVMLFEYALPDFSVAPFVKNVLASPAVTPVTATPPAAAAAPAAPPAAPPSAANPLEAEMMRSSPGVSTPVGTVGATPGATGDSGRALPPITLNRQAQSPASGQQLPSSNATGSLTRDVQSGRQEELARKEQELRALETDISAKLEQMELLENRLNTMMKDADNAEEAKFRHTVDMLSSMKAKQAAAVLTTLDERIAVKVLAGMRGRQAGEILTFVDPQKAARLTESLVRMQLPFE